jgi:hypothetical protein
MDVTGLATQAANIGALIFHLGPLSGGPSYLSAARCRLPKARCGLDVAHDGKNPRKIQKENTCES